MKTESGTPSGSQPWVFSQMKSNLMFAFTWQIAQKSKQIKELREVLTLKEGQRAENQTLASSIAEQRRQMERMLTGMVYDPSRSAGLGLRTAAT